MTDYMTPGDGASMQWCVMSSQILDAGVRQSSVMVGHAMEIGASRCVTCTVSPYKMIFSMKECVVRTFMVSHFPQLVRQKIILRSK